MVLPPLQVILQLLRDLGPQRHRSLLRQPALPLAPDRDPALGPVHFQSVAVQGRLRADDLEAAFDLIDREEAEVLLWVHEPLVRPTRNWVLDVGEVADVPKNGPGLLEVA